MCVGKQVEEQESQEEAGQVNEASLYRILDRIFLFLRRCLCVVNVHVLLPVWKVAEETLAFLWNWFIRPWAGGWWDEVACVAVGERAHIVRVL